MPQETRRQGCYWAKAIDLPPALRAEILRDIVGTPFYSRSTKIAEYTKDPAFLIDANPEWLTWNNRTIPLMVDAMLNEECSGCGGRGGWIDGDEGQFVSHLACHGKGRIPRAEPRWIDMPVIADALEEAGCRDQHILEHLRSERDGERCPHCSGDGWTMELGYVKFQEEKCSHCNGTGRIKRRHWRGCHVVELIRGV